jgi:hypothetical protein
LGFQSRFFPGGIKALDPLGEQGLDGVGQAVQMLFQRRRPGIQPMLGADEVLQGLARQDLLNAACGRAGITQGRGEPEGVILHDIRRTVKTNMLSAGVDKVYRDTILGHSLKGMDIYYMAPSEDDLHRAMGIYTEWLDAQMQSVDHFVAKVNQS